MKASEVFEAAPGSVTLLYCEDEHLEEMVTSIRSSVPEHIKERASLNASTMISMEMCPEETPNGFHDLAVLCSRLITAAGKRSHFEGVLLLNVASLLLRPEDFDRLRALGEVLTIEDGLASECTTLIYGPTDEMEVLIAADALDFDGHLKVEHFETVDHRDSLEELLHGACLLPTSEKTMTLLQSTINEMHDERRFDPLRFVQSCSKSRGMITEDSVQAVLDDPFSYVNRLKKTRVLIEQRKNQLADRRIGFKSDT